VENIFCFVLDIFCGTGLISLRLAVYTILQLTTGISVLYSSISTKVPFKYPGNYLDFRWIFVSVA
jgi:hypothetical protein